MSDTKHTPGPWAFEPHNGYGSSIDGEPMPFGYISTNTPAPIFQLDTPLKYSVEELTANAHLMASAPELYEALADLLQLCKKSPFPCVDAARKALSKARGGET